MKTLTAFSLAFTALALIGCADIAQTGRPLPFDYASLGPAFKGPGNVAAYLSDDKIHGERARLSHAPFSGWDCNDFAWEAKKAHPGSVLTVVVTEAFTDAETHVHGREQHMVAMDPQTGLVWDSRNQQPAIGVPWWSLRGYSALYRECPRGWCILKGWN
jgi:hypothetical protein